MYDSLKAHIRLNTKLDISCFTHHRGIDDLRSDSIVYRHWIASDGIHLNYRHQPMIDEGILSIEVPLAQWTKTDRAANPTQKDYNKALSRINGWLHDHLPHDDIPCITTWTVDRIDYCYNFDVADVDTYLMMVRALHCGKLSRVEHEHGVTWKNDSRWVKFYDKGQQLGDGTHTLRFEVTNHRAAVSYMCKRWFGCARIVSELLHPMRAWYVLSRFMSELGLNNPDVYQSDVVLMQRIHTLYPTRTAIAIGMLYIIRTHGSSAYTQHIINRSSYYRWLKRFRTHNLLPTPTHALPVLHISSAFFTQQHSQNLDNTAGGADTSSQKIWWEKFGLKIEPTAEMRAELERHAQAQIMG